MADDQASTFRRRAVLTGALLGAAGAAIRATMSGCSTSRRPGNEPRTAGQPPSRGGSVLLAYLSRAGENYYNGGRRRLTVGNTQVVAQTISRLIGCYVHRIEAADPYPDDYDPTVERNVREQQADARPAIANPLTSIERYDTVLLGSPIWNVRAPMIMSTFTESLDFTGKTIHPFTTYAMSGLGTTERDYAATCPGATLGEGLAVRGEEATPTPARPSSPGYAASACCDAPRPRTATRKENTCEQAHARHQWTAGLRDRPRLHGAQSRLRPTGRPPGRHQSHPRRRRPRRHLLRHRPDVRAVHQRRTRRASPGTRTRAGRHRHQVRLRLRRRPFHRPEQPPRTHQGHRRGLPAPAGRGPHRPALPAPRRPRRADRGRRRHGEGPHRRRQGRPLRPLRGRRRGHPPRPRRAAGHRPAERILALVA